MDRRYVRLDPAKLDFLRLKRGWTLEALVEAAAAASPPIEDKRTVNKIVRGEPVFLNNAKALASLLGAEDLVSVLHPDLLAEIGPPSSWEDPLAFFTGVGEWEAVELASPVEQAPNGLYYDCWRLRHRFVPKRIARGKCYDLKRLSAADKMRHRDYLVRHGEVVDRIGAHPHIVKNWTTTPWEHGAMFWIVDEWVEGERLDAVLRCGPLATAEAPRILREIALGLQALHQAQVVRRELAPRYVWLRNEKRSVVLTDFELAKLFDGAPTVSPAAGWPDDDYRALEVDGTTPVDERADVFGWGRIAVEAVCGSLPPRGAEEAAINAAGLPKGIVKTLLACVAPARSDRPDSMAAVLAGIKRWK